LHRCFGDKGDVEDITEGKSWLLDLNSHQTLSPFNMTSEEDTDYSETGFREADRFDSADIISTVEFDHTGNYLATGDKGGRVVLFERNETVSRNTAEFHDLLY
jgi:serine/threonine-protein phosphatase 2A regulatory subunit B